MKKTILLLGLSIGMIFALSSCGKKGCTDVDAKNYCDKCKKDDGTCTYSAEASVWWDASTSLNMPLYGTVKVYFDGVYGGQASADEYWTAGSGCGTPLKRTYDLGKSKSKSISINVKIYDDTGTLDDEKTISATINASNDCNDIQFTY